MSGLEIGIRNFPRRNHLHLTFTNERLYLIVQEQKLKSYLKFSSSNKLRRHLSIRLKDNMVGHEQCLFLQIFFRKEVPSKHLPIQRQQ